MSLPQDLTFAPKQGYVETTQIIVKEEYKSMLPRPSEKEHEQMKKSMNDDGQDKAIVVDQNMVLIDGHTRLKICKELNKQVFYEQKYFKDRADILRHMAIANLHRRNLSQYQKVILYDELYKIEIVKSRQRSVLGKKISLLEKKGEDTEELQKELETGQHGRASDTFAKIIGVSGAVVRRSTFVKENAGKKLIEQVKHGETTLSNAFWQTKEKLQLKIPVENTKEYFFTITPKEGSQWTCHRKLKNKQLASIKSFILNIKVENKPQQPPKSQKVYPR